jgi:hypothetical protein
MAFVAKFIVRQVYQITDPFRRLCVFNKVKITFPQILVAKVGLNVKFCAEEL